VETLLPLALVILLLKTEMLQEMELVMLNPLVETPMLTV
jgi:hypothetical protein